MTYWRGSETSNERKQVTDSGFCLNTVVNLADNELYSDFIYHVLNVYPKCKKQVTDQHEFFLHYRK